MKDKKYYESLDKRSKEYREYKKGLGDRVEDITNALGIKKCKGCNERQDSLNLVGHELQYFFKKHNPNKFTEEDILQWDNFISRENKDEINSNQQRLIVRLLKDILNMSVKPCTNCSGKVWKKYIKMIQTVYERN